MWIRTSRFLHPNVQFKDYTNSIIIITILNSGLVGQWLARSAFVQYVGSERFESTCRHLSGTCASKGVPVAGNLWRGRVPVVGMLQTYTHARLFHQT